MCRKDGQTPPQLDANELNNFLNFLQLEIDKFNTFFVDKEEEYVIKWKELQERVAGTMDSNEQLMSLRREIVDFHGEMVLLENYSALNYAGLLKIIKKYDKKTGALLRSPFIQDVVNQPFFEIDVLNKLVKECEVILSILFTNGTCSSIGDDFEADGFGTMNGYENKDTLMQVPEELAEIENLEKMFTQLTVSALHSLEEIRGRIVGPAKQYKNTTNKC